MPSKKKIKYVVVLGSGYLDSHNYKVCESVKITFNPSELKHPDESIVSADFAIKGDKAMFESNLTPEMEKILSNLWK